MKKKSTKRLTISRETLHRMEQKRLHEAAAGSGVVQPCPESVSYCITQLCVSALYTGCVECES